MTNEEGCDMVSFSQKDVLHAGVKLQTILVVAGRGILHQSILKIVLLLEVLRMFF